MPWTQCFFLPNIIKCSFCRLGSRMDARSEGRARERGFLRACFPSHSFQTRPINKGPPFRPPSDHSHKHQLFIITFIQSWTCEFHQLSFLSSMQTGNQEAKLTFSIFLEFAWLLWPYFWQAEIVDLDPGSGFCGCVFVQTCSCTRCFLGNVSCKFSFRCFCLIIFCFHP